MSIANPAVPAIAWATPAAISYGTALSATQLNATTSVPGIFVYSPGAGAVLPGGTNTLSVTFTPADLVNYSTTTKTVSLTVNKVNVTLSLTSYINPTMYPNGVPFTVTSTPRISAVITFYDNGTAIGARQMTGGSVPIFVMVAPTAGTHTITASSPGDIDYNPATSAAVIQTVNKATPVINWANPAAIINGTALSAAQLNSTASVPGIFAYNPPTGTKPSVGVDTLSVIFTPTDGRDYNIASSSVTINVLAIPVITSVTPASGKPGALITISGSGFGAIPGTSTITFNGIPASPKTWSDTSITAPLPSGATTGNVVVKTAGGSSNGWSFSGPAAPYVSSLSLSQGPVGMGLSISGVNLGSAATGDTIGVTVGSFSLGNTPMILVPGTWSNTGITVQVPPGAISGSIVVTVDGVVSNSEPFTVTGAFGCPL